jgi:hypothetical protein
MGEDGSTARTAIVFPSALRDVMRALTVVDFPTPGDPVMPITREAEADECTCIVGSFSAYEIARANSLGLFSDTDFKSACHSGSGIETAVIGDTLR